jgi:RimJ/RimL family protein N-acetyltransferase
MVRLRKLKIDDALILAELANDKEIAQFLTDAFPHPYTLKDAERFIERASSEKPQTVFGITIEHKLAGAIGVHPKSDVYRKTAQLGYWLGAPYRGKGYIGKALEQILAYAFEELDLIRVEAGVYSPNEKSVRALEKAGFKMEGILRDAIVKNNGVLDLKMYSILKSDFK